MIATADSTKVYRAICVYTSIAESAYLKNFKSYLFEGLHIHILNSSLLFKQDFLVNCRLLYPHQTYEPVLYQWGTLQQLNNKTRYPCVNEIERRQMGGILGIGSAATGGLESDHVFIGGGEGFVWQEQAFRVVKGGLAYLMRGSDQYWFLQISSFRQPILMNGFSFSGSFDDLAKQLIQEFGSDVPAFIATFECCFDALFFRSRSNGIFPTDNVIDSNLNIFDQDKLTQGGHFLGRQNKIIVSIKSPIFFEPFYKIKLMNEKIEINLR